MERAAFVKTVAVNGSIIVEVHAELQGIGGDLRAILLTGRAKKLQLASSLPLKNLDLRIFLEHGDSPCELRLSCETYPRAL
jgi:hypothetical protein